MTQPYVPAWAEKELGPKKNPSHFDIAELELLRDFFDAWEEFHKIKGPGNLKKKREEAAERLVSKAFTIRRIRNG